MGINRIQIKDPDYLVNEMSALSAIILCRNDRQLVGTLC